jgi:aquaporin Z
LSGAMWALGGISGGAFNPAVALGAIVAGMFEWADYWLYLIGATLGAAAAASAFLVVYGERE